MTPWGTTAVDEVVDGGVTILRTGPQGREWSDEALASALAWNDAAAERGVFTWVNLRELAWALPGTEGEARLREVVETLKDSPGFGLWKGADEPWPRFEPADLEPPSASSRSLTRTTSSTRSSDRSAETGRSSGTHRTRLTYGPTTPSPTRTGQTCTRSTTASWDSARRPPLRGSLACRPAAGDRPQRRDDDAPDLLHRQQEPGLTRVRSPTRRQERS